MKRFRPSFFKGIGYNGFPFEIRLEKLVLDFCWTVSELSVVRLECMRRFDVVEKSKIGFGCFYLWQYITSSRLSQFRRLYVCTCRSCLLRVSEVLDQCMASRTIFWMYSQKSRYVSSLARCFELA